MIVFAARQGADDDMGRMPMQLVTVLIELISNLYGLRAGTASVAR